MERPVRPLLDLGSLAARPSQEVFAPRWNAGFIPSSYWQKGVAPVAGPRAQPLLPGFVTPQGRLAEEDHADEERRLAHVAATRARERLYISYVRYSKAWEKRALENASGLVMDLLAEHMEQPAGAPVVRAVRLPQSQEEKALLKLPGYIPAWDRGRQPHPQWP